MSKTKEKNTAPLYGWQSDVVEKIVEHEERRESEQFQGLAEFHVNRQLSTTIIMPSGSGHTYLANYIASKFPSIVVYGDVKHLNEITERFVLHPQSETVSMYEMFYALFKPDVQQPAPELVELNQKFCTKKVVVVDNFLRVPAHVRDYIMGTVRGPIVFLGH
jgi:hypothetical protein